MNKIISLCLILFFFYPAGSRAEQPPSVSGVTEKIIRQTGPWSGFKAQVTLEFATESTHAACQGDLTYSRIEEKAMLDCYNLKGKLLFSYTAKDEEFELYLPGTSKAIHGTIFDAKYSPEVSLHLEPLDLYRALKIIPVIPESAWLDGGGLRLRLSVRNTLNQSLARILEVTSEGDVPHEIFYRPDESPDVEIQRRDFKTFKVQGFKGKAHYPRVVEIQSLQAPRKTRLIFRSMTFLKGLGSEDWPQSRLSRGTLTERLASAKE